MFYLYGDEKKDKKREYAEPIITRIELDNEISLDLESQLPAGEPTWLSSNDHFDNNPMKG